MTLNVILVTPAQLHGGENIWIRVAKRQKQSGAMVANQILHTRAQHAKKEAACLLERRATLERIPNLVVTAIPPVRNLIEQLVRGTLPISRKLSIGCLLPMLLELRVAHVRPNVQSSG